MGRGGRRRHAVWALLALLRADPGEEALGRHWLDEPDGPSTGSALKRRIASLTAEGRPADSVGEVRRVARRLVRVLVRSRQDRISVAVPVAGTGCRDRGRVAVARGPCREVDVGERHELRVAGSGLEDGVVDRSRSRLVVGDGDRHGRKVGVGDLELGDIEARDLLGLFADGTHKGRALVGLLLQRTIMSRAARDPQEYVEWYLSIPELVPVVARDVFLA